MHHRSACSENDPKPDGEVVASLENLEETTAFSTTRRPAVRVETIQIQWLTVSESNNQANFGSDALNENTVPLRHRCVMAQQVRARALIRRWKVPHLRQTYPDSRSTSGGFRFFR